MADESISTNDAVSKWHLTKRQAKKLDKMDGEVNSQISGSVYIEAKEYYEKLEQEGKAYGRKEGKTLIGMIKNALQSSNSESNNIDKGDVEVNENGVEPTEEEVAEKPYAEMTYKELIKEFNKINEESDHLKKRMEEETNIEGRIKLLKEYRNKLEIMKQINQLMEEHEKDIVSDCIAKATIALLSLNPESLQEALNNIGLLLECMPEKYKEELENCKGLLLKAMDESTTTTKE